MYILFLSSLCQRWLDGQYFLEKVKTFLVLEIYYLKNIFCNICINQVKKYYKQIKVLFIPQLYYFEDSRR